MDQSILIVEDNAVMGNLLQFNLKCAGFQTVVASNAERGLRLAAEHQFDLVIADHMLPEMSGAEMCKHLRGMPQYCGIPVVICTARGLELDLTQLQNECGVTDLLFKPVSPRQIVTIVSDLLAPVTAG